MDPNTQQPVQPQQPPAQPQQPAAIPQVQGGRQPFKLFLYALGAIMLIFIILALFLSGSSSSSEDLSRLAAQQSEIARVANLGVDDDKANSSTRILATTIRITSTSAVNELAGLGAVPTEAEIAEFTDGNADSLLESSKQNNKFNDTFSQVMSSLLDNALTSINGIDVAGLETDEKALVEDLATSYQILVDDING